MRDRWSNDQKGHDRGKQNDCAKTSATWRHDFLFAKIGEKLRESCLRLLKKIIQKPGWIANSFERRCRDSTVPASGQ